MDLFEHYDFDPLETEVPSYPFFQLGGIAWEAREMLVGLTKQEVISIGYSVADCVDEMRQLYGKNELDDLVERIIKDGSWELKHLPKGSDVNPDSVRHLLENWPAAAEDIPGFSTGDDLSESDAFRMAVYCGHYPFGSEFYASTPIVGAAVLTLQSIASCVHTLGCPDDEWAHVPEGPISSRLISAANEAIEASVSLGLAKEFAAEMAAQNDLDMDEQELLKQHEDALNKARARNAALRRHSATSNAKRYIQSEWLANGSAYMFNKSDFARSYVKLVAQKFCDKRGDPLTITEKTIREVWLANPPAA